jgi:AcrR family transcriptional regulator
VRTTPAATEARTPARERLLDAANELFYAEGVQTVGIDRIIQRAGVAKASLYNLFGSKEELVAAYLASRHDRTASRLTRAMDQVDHPRQKILAVFDFQAQQYQRPDFNGCAFMAATTEASSEGLVEQAADRFRAWMRTMFTDLAQQAGASDPECLGRQLHVLYDGAGVSGRMDHGDAGLAPSMRAAAETLVDAAVAPREESRRRL